jgi:hypothetical protein
MLQINLKKITKYFLFLLKLADCLLVVLLYEFDLLGSSFP